MEEVRPLFFLTRLDFADWDGWNSGRSKPCPQRRLSGACAYGRMASELSVVWERASTAVVQPDTEVEFLEDGQGKGYSLVQRP